MMVRDARPCFQSIGVGVLVRPSHHQDQGMKDFLEEILPAPGKVYLSQKTVGTTPRPRLTRMSLSNATKSRKSIRQSIYREKKGDRGE